MDSETIRFIREEIRRSMNAILPGQAGVTTQESEDINELFPGMPAMPARPVVHPYGFASRAPQGTQSVVGRMGDHRGNNVVLGHRDKDRPDDLDEGAAAVYSVGLYTVRILNDKIEIGKDGDFETVVMGESLRQLLISLIQKVVAHTHLGNLGAPTGPPLNAAEFTLLQSNNLDNKMILAEDGGRF